MLLRWRWPILVGIIVALLLAVVERVNAQAVGTPHDTSWFQYFIVGIGGTALVVLYRAMMDGREIKQALVGFGGEPGLIADVRELKAWMTQENGHRQSLGDSVSRLDGTSADLQRRAHHLEAWADMVGLAVGHPFRQFPTMDQQMRRERDAG